MRNCRKQRVNHIVPIRDSGQSRLKLITLNELHKTWGRAGSLLMFYYYCLLIFVFSCWQEFPCLTSDVSAVCLPFPHDLLLVCKCKNKAFTQPPTPLGIHALKSLKYSAESFNTPAVLICWKVWERRDEPTGRKTDRLSLRLLQHLEQLRHAWSSTAEKPAR